MNNYTISQAIVKGDLQAAVEQTQAALSSGVDPQTLIQGHLIVGMSEIGEAFEAKKAFVPNLLMAARAMKGALELIKPLLHDSNVVGAGRVVIGTVKGDLHDIGKNLVASMLEGCGFEVIDLGVDVAPETFIAAIESHDADIVCMSALLTTTMVCMKDVVDAINASGLRHKVKIMIGGAPISHSYSEEIGADGYSDNANSAVALARSLSCMH